MPWTWYDGIVTKIEDVTSTTKKFTIRAPEILSFKAGQFITLDLPISDKRLKRWRSYSIANHPMDSLDLELIIVKMKGGKGTSYLFNEIKEGSIIPFKGPSGAFVLPKVKDKKIVMICTGTGIAPFRSFLLEIEKEGKKDLDLHLIFGTRTEEGILYREEMEKRAATWSNFSYDIALSREKQWSGYKGHVHQVYLEKYTHQYHDVEFYLCGWSIMVDEAREKLKELGVVKENINYELYG